MIPGANRKKQSRLQDDGVYDRETVFRGEPGDFVVAVMGLTGVGKSTFINHAISKLSQTATMVRIGHDLESCTSELQPIPILPENFPPSIEIGGDPHPLQGSIRRLVLVDTPGFDDTYVGNPEILECITTWLASSYQHNMKFGGIIYLHDISQTRRDRNCRPIFEKLHTLCSNDAVGSFLLVTTKWDDDLRNEAGPRREAELRDNFWSEMLKSGAQMSRFDGNFESAWKLFQCLLIPGPAFRRSFKLQQEHTSEPHTSEAILLPTQATVRPKLNQKQTKYLKRARAKAEKANEPFFEGRTGDVVVAVMGPTGVGKSTFVKYLIEDRLGQEATVLIGHDLESCTVRLQPIPISREVLPPSLIVKDQPHSLQGEMDRLVIVDTPGLNDTYENDSEVLTRIAEWLASSYSQDMKLGGVIYLHDISQLRMLGTHRKNFEMLSALCGNDAQKSVVLATTKWDLVKPEVGMHREAQLHDKFWKQMTNGGAQTCRFSRSSASAWEIVENLLKPASKTRILLRIQEELVEMQRIIPTTEAGKQLRYTMKELFEFLRNSEQSDRQEAEKKEVIMQNLHRQIDELKIPLLYRFEHLFSFSRQLMS